MTFYENFAALCKQKGMKPSRVAEECGINRSNVSNWKKNGYTPRAEDLKKIAEFLHVPVGYLLQTETEREYSSGYGWYPPEKFWDKINNDRARFLHYYMEGDPDCIDEIESVWNISVAHPELASDETFRNFVECNVRLVSFLPNDGVWQIRVHEKKGTPYLKVVPEITYDDFAYAMYNEAKDLPQDKKDMLLNMAKFMRKELEEEEDK